MTTPQLPDRSGSRWERAFEDLQRRHAELQALHRSLSHAVVRLRASRAPYEGFFERMPVAYCTLDSSGVIGYINPAGRRLLGLSSLWTQRPDISSQLSKRQHAVFQMQVAACFSRGEPVDLELTLHRNGVPPTVIHLRGTPQREEDGSISACNAAFMDITDRKRAEADLRFLARVGKQLLSSLDRRRIAAIATRTALPRLGDAAILFLSGSDPGRFAPTVAYVNRRIDDSALHAAALSLSLEEGDGRPDPASTEIYPRPAVPGADTLLASSLPPPFRDLGCHTYLRVPLLAGGVSIGTMYFLRCKSTGSFSVLDLDLAGALAERVAAVLENARLFQEAQEAIRLRQDVLAIVSHDLRTPLHSMLLNVEMLLASVPREERRAVGRKQIDVIRRSVLRMDRMIADLLDLSSIEAGHLSVQRDRNLLRGMLTEVIESFTPGIAARNIDLSIELPNDEMVVPCDRERIIQVLANLLGNAVKFTPVGGRIRIWCTPRYNEVRISLFNSGPGIPASRLPRVFDRYWQASETAQGGRGLGLFIAKGIVEAHAGHIRAQSEPGRGSTFTVSLPLDVAEDGAGSMHPDGQQPGAGGKPRLTSILIVEDEVEQREAMAAVLAEVGHQVEVASDGTAALELIETRDPTSVVLLDLNLPGVRGETLIQKFHGHPRWAAVPVVLVSSEPDVAATSASLGAAAYLRKPVRSEALVRTVNRFAGAARLK